MDFLKNKNSKSQLDFSKLNQDTSFGFEKVISDIDIEKQMTEFTFKQIMS